MLPTVLVAPAAAEFHGAFRHSAEWLWPIAAIVMVAALFAAIMAGIGRNLPKRLELAPLTRGPIPPLLQTSIAELEQLGFERLGPALVAHLQIPTLIAPMVHRGACAHAAVYFLTAPRPRTACDFVTVFGDRACAVTTASIPDAGTLPPPDGALLQIIRGSAEQRFRAHAEALALVAEHGFRGAHVAATSDEFVELMRGATAAQRREFFAAPIRNTCLVLFRALTKLNPYTRPITSQPLVRERLQQRAAAVNATSSTDRVFA